jgi:putative transposase
MLADADVRAYVTTSFRAIAEAFGFWIDTLAVEEDHVHVFLEFPPKSAIARVVGILKSISARRTLARFGSLRRKFGSGELWEDGYAARTVGDHGTADRIKRYIRRHDAAQATKQPEFF